MARTPTRTIPDHAAGTPARTPNVLIILVTGDVPDRLRRCLTALSKQTHPRIGILAVDNGSGDGSSDVLRASLGAERVIRLSEPRSFQAAVGEALRSDLASRADYVLFMQDDTVLEPDATTALVDAAERMEGVGAVGPKVLDAQDPSILREIGMSVDIFGHPYSPLEKGEIDQGQYDRIREVFYVTSTAMLVSTAAVARVGVPDERLGSDLDAMDFCWRIRLAGFRILWTPTAVALQPGGSRARAAKALGSGPLYQRERGALAAVLKNDGFLSLAWVLPFAFGQMIVRVLFYLLSRRFEDGYQVVAAWGWNAAHLFGTGRRRARAQAVRATPDRRIRQLMAPMLLRLNRWWRTLMEALRSESDPDAADGARPTVWTRVRAAAIAHPVAVGWVLAVLVGAIAYRHLWTAPSLAGGALAEFPPSPRGFFGEFVSGLRHTALGGTAPASPALPMLGAASTLAFANPSFAQKVLLLILPFLAGVGCHRALRTIPIERAAATVGAACYALSPILLWGLSEGRLPDLVFLAGLPWLASRLIGFFGSNPPRHRVRWIVGAAVGLAALAAFFPGAVLGAAIIAAVAVALPGGGGRLRGLARFGLATAGALVLAWPVVSGIAGSDGRSLGEPLGTASFGQVLRTVIGRAPGDWWLAFFLPLAAVLGLALASGPRAKPAARSTLMALAGVYLGWAAANAWLPAWLSNPAAYACVAAFGMASLIALGLDSVIDGLQRRSFGAAQFSSAALVALVAIGLAGQVIQAARGAWEIGGPDKLSAAYAAVLPRGGTPYRVLWVGRHDGGRLVAPGGQPMGTAGSGSSAVRFAVTAPAGASAYDLARPLDASGYDRLVGTLDALLAGPTRHAGALLAPFAVRFVIAGENDLPALVQRRLEQQVDMVEVDAGGLVVFRDTVAIPPSAVVPDPRWGRAAVSGDVEAVAELQDPRAVPLGGAGGRLHEPAAGGPWPPGTSILLTQQFDRHWRLTPSSGPALSARSAFGWAVGFPYRPGTGGFTVRYTGQALRTLQVALLSAIWLAALWITRRPSGAE